MLAPQKQPSEPIQSEEELTHINALSSCWRTAVRRRSGAHRIKPMRHVRFGPLTDISRLIGNVRFQPQSRHTKWYTAQSGRVHLLPLGPARCAGHMMFESRRVLGNSRWGVPLVGSGNRGPHIPSLWSSYGFQRGTAHVPRPWIKAFCCGAGLTLNFFRSALTLRLTFG